MLITEAYRAKNAALHQSNGGFGGKAQKRLSAARILMRQYECSTVLDYGCGKGGLVRALFAEGFDVQGYDPCVPEFNFEPFPADFVVCYEGPEHWEEDCVDAVLAHVASLTRKAAWICTALRKGGDIFEDGTNAHVCIHDADWWLDKFSQHFQVTEIRSHKEGDVLDVVCLK